MWSYTIYTSSLLLENLYYSFDPFSPNLLCLQVFVPGVLACSSHVEKGDKVAVSVAVEQPVKDGGWAVGITRGTVLQGLQSGKLF
jgi:hypothetical protein